MKKLILSSVFALSMLGNTVSAQSEPFLGQIAFVAFNFVPQGWAACDGQTLSINQNAALFSLLGTQYGGNGQTTFNLPDMRGRSVKSDGTGPGLSPYIVGQSGGVEKVSLAVSQMPTHNHQINAVEADGNQSNPKGNLPANTKALDQEYSDQTGKTTMSSSMVSATGGGLPHENLSPYLTLKCIIALQGIYPSRD